jgi:hypothetical protein
MRYRNYSTYCMYANIFHEIRKSKFLFEQRIENVPFFLIKSDETPCNSCKHYS